MPFSSFKPGMMFHQRLLLLGALVTVGMVAPVYQMFRWSIRHGDQCRTQAQSYLSSWRWLPTTRGRILDRQGRVLAADRPSFDIAVDYRVITGQWAYTQAFARAKRLHRADWSKLSRAQRRELAEQYEPEFRARLDAMWDQFAQLGGITREELEAHKEAVKARVQNLAAQIRRSRQERQDDKSGPISEETMGHVLLSHVSDQVAFEFLRRTADAALEADDAAAAMPGVSVIDTGTREYPLDTLEVTVDRSSFPGPLRAPTPAVLRVEGVGTHILGWMRHRVFKEDNADEYLRPQPQLLPDGTPDRSLYLDGESIGQTGMERGAERELRGLRGIQTTRLDTQEVLETPAEPGRDITLTIDAQLQARIQAILNPALGLTVVQPWHSTKHLETEPPHNLAVTGEPLAASSVVIDIATGDILALVSSPTFSHETLRDQPEAVFKDPLLMPSLNRAIAQPYAPGSIVKPLILCAAITEGKVTTEERIKCTGHYYPNQPKRLQCWTQKYFNKNHEMVLGRDLDGRDALMGSCNIFFYEMGHRLGPTLIVQWFERFGVGPRTQRWNLGIGDEYPGALPHTRAQLTDDASILLGIGQGPIAWTPLHAADVYATIGRAGIRILPHIRKDVPPQVTDLHLNPRAVDQALAGLAAAVRESPGTANHITFEDPVTGAKNEELIFNAVAEPGISVWGKSGTADASALTADVNKDGKREILRDGDHAWCVFLVGDEGMDGHPKYAVSVVVDYGGSGGRVAGPIANQVVRALIAEGYLHPKGKAKDSTQARSGKVAE